MSGTGLSERAGNLLTSVVNAFKSSEDRQTGNGPAETSIFGILKNALRTDPISFEQVKDTEAFQHEMRKVYRRDQTDRLEQTTSAYSGGPAEADRVHDALSANAQQISTRARWLSENTLAVVDLKDCLDCRVNIRMLGSDIEQAAIKKLVRNHEERMSEVDSSLVRANNAEQWGQKGALVGKCEELLVDLSNNLKQAGLELIIPYPSPGQSGRYYIARMQPEHQAYPPGISDAMAVLASRGHGPI